MRSTPGRLALFIVLALFAGALTNLGVSWWIALRNVPAKGFSWNIPINIRPEGEPVYVGHINAVRFGETGRDGFALTRLHFDTPEPALSPMLIERARIAQQKEWGDRTPAPGLPNILVDWPEWFVDLTLDEPRLTGFRFRCVGWPMLALQSCTLIQENQEESRWQMRVYDATKYLTFRGAEPERGTIPLRPMWPGFVVNSLFYAAPWLVAALGWQAFRSFRARRRLARRECPVCGYSMVGAAPGTPCPECGQAASSAIDSSPLRAQPPEV